MITITQYCKVCKKRQRMFDKGLNELFLKDMKGNKLLRCSKCFQLTLDK